MLYKEKVDGIEIRHFHVHIARLAIGFQLKQTAEVVRSTVPGILFGGGGSSVTGCVLPKCMTYVKIYWFCALNDSSFSPLNR